MREAGDRTSVDRARRRLRTIGAQRCPPSTRRSTVPRWRRSSTPNWAGAGRRPGLGSNGVAAKAIALTIPGMPERRSGQRAVGAVPRGSRQPGHGSLRRASRRARTRARGRAAGPDAPPRRPRARQAAGDPGGADAATEPAAPLCAISPATALGPAAHPRRWPALPPWGRTPPSRPGCPCGWGHARLGRHGGVPARGATGSIGGPGREYTAAAPAHEMLADYPVALRSSGRRRASWTARPRPVRGVESAGRAAAAVGGRCHRRDEPFGGWLVHPRRATPPTRRKDPSTTAT